MNRSNPSTCNLCGGPGPFVAGRQRCRACRNKSDRQRRGAQQRRYQQEDGDPNVILVFPDLHAPFQHRDALDFCVWLRDHYNPGHVICLGDEIDQHNLSNYDKSPDGLSPLHEHEAAVEVLKGFYEAFPKVKVCTSNHTARYLKRAFKFGIPEKFLRSYAEILEAPPGWEWADYWEIDGIRFDHGEGGSGYMGALKCAEKNMQSTVIGHLHASAGILWQQTPHKLIFGFNVGCLIDTKVYAFAYNKHDKVRPVLGAGIISYGIPVFIPMILDEEGRWDQDWR